MSCAGESCGDDKRKVERTFRGGTLLGLENLCAAALLNVRVFFASCMLRLRAEDERSKETGGVCDARLSGCK
jgi:hypothetical protein